MTPTSIVEAKTGPPILLRAIWYLFVGWWLTAVVMGIAWVAAILIVTLPLTFLINRIPTVMTLRPRREQHVLVTGADGVMRYQRIATGQSSLLVRIVYFVFIGSWLSLLWMVLSYAFMLTIIGIPIGLMMVNRLPLIFTLHRGYA